MRPLARLARAVFEAVVAECDPRAAFDRCVVAEPGAWVVDGSRVDLASVDDVRVLAIGKPALALARSCSLALDRAGVSIAARRGVAAVPKADASFSAHSIGPWLEAIPGGHPYPDSASLRAGRRMLSLCSQPCTDRTFVVALVGGGGSSMAEWPVVADASAEEIADLNRRLVRASLSIREVNAIRKRISAIKGGRLAMAAQPARMLTLVVSDVPSGDVASVASGPTVEDDTTREEVLASLERVDFSGSAGARLVLPGNLAEPPTWSASDRERVRSVVLLDATNTAEYAAMHVARSVDEVRNLGELDGGIEDVARAHLDALATLAASRPGAICAVVSSGEAILNVRGSGTGGRNQHLVLAALVAARDRSDGLRDFAFLGAGTDGVDGNSSAAGAIGWHGLLDEARTRGLDASEALDDFDSAGFFGPLGAQIVCGPTGTNVRDLRVFIGIAG